MKLSVPFIQLPLLFDAGALAAEIEALGEDPWMPHPQGFAGNSMLPLVAVDGDPANESFAGPMRATPVLQACPYLSQVIAAMGVTVGRTRLMRLSGQAEVKRHADQGYYWADRVRVHVPVVTQPTVRFECGDAAINMAAGECWIFDTWRQHRVLNDDSRSRIHLVVDTVGGDGFWSHVAAGRNHDAPATAPGWQPRHVPYAPGEKAELRFESANVPVVMTPWEVIHRIRFLFAEAVPHPALQQAHPVALAFCRRWQALWAAFGEQEAGLPHYRRELDGFMGEMRRLTDQVVLVNELSFYGALGSWLGKIAVAGDGPRPSDEAVSPAAARQPSGSVAQQAPGPRADPLFDRPVFVVSTPRSGSTMLFEALAQAVDVYTIGGESHSLIEGVPELSPARNNVDSNRLTSEMATAPIAGALRERFWAQLRDRAGGRPSQPPVRMLEKTPKNALRVPFLARVFPEALFVYLYRDPRQTLASMLDAWNSGRFRTYPHLPGWDGMPWSLLLTPGWRECRGKPLPDVVVHQWESTTRTLVEDLAALPPGRVTGVDYDALVRAPQREIERVCDAVGFRWDRSLEGTLPLSRYTLTPPDPLKWRRHAAEIEPRLEAIGSTIARAERFAAALAG